MICIMILFQYDSWLLNLLTWVLMSCGLVALCGCDVTCLILGAPKLFYHLQRWYLMALISHLELFARGDGTGLTQICHGQCESYYKCLFRASDEKSFGSESWKCTVFCGNEKRLTSLMTGSVSISVLLYRVRVRVKSQSQRRSMFSD